MISYKPTGVCSRQINFEIENGIITKCEFIGGCRGNTQGLSKLVIGMTPEEVILRLEGTECRGGTSCPDQLAKALKQHLNK